MDPLRQAHWRMAAVIAPTVNMFLFIFALTAQEGTRFWDAVLGSCSKLRLVKLGMRLSIFLLGILLFFTASVGAQGPTGTAAGTPSEPRYNSENEREFHAWQIAIGYQYNRANLLGSPFNTHGVNVDLARFFGRWFGVEAQIGSGFLGNTAQTSTPPNLGVKSVYVGGGPRLALRNRSRYEPWIHVTVGMEHYRFTQTGGLLGSNNALAGDGGVGLDIHLKTNLALRGEVDAVASRFFSTSQRSFQAIGGLVLSF